VGQVLTTIPLEQLVVALGGLPTHRSFYAWMAVEAVHKIERRAKVVPLPVLLPVVQPQKYAPVRNLMLYLTEDCNLRCSYCFVKKEPRTMTREVALRTLDYVLQRNISGGLFDLNVTFFGGEPFLGQALNRMQEVVDYAQQSRPNVYKTFRFAATTNGTLANARVEKVIKDGAMHLLISLDGGAGYNARRPMLSGRESYSLVAKNLPRLSAWSPRCSVRMTFTPDPIDLVQRVREVLSIGPFSSLALCPVVEADWSGREEALEVAYEQLGDWFLQEVAQGRRPPLTITWLLLQKYIQRLGCQSPPQRPCPVGDSLLAVDTQGQVLPCHRFLHQRQLGTVYDEHLPPARWQYVHLKTLEIEECPRCEARTVCGGGCRAVAQQAGYGMEGVHPNHCRLLRPHMRQVQRIYQALHQQERFWDYFNQVATEPEALGYLATLGS
jgi:uncharacterized protein